MASLSSINSFVKYLFYVIDVFTKHAWVKPLTDKIAERFIRSLKNKIYKVTANTSKTYLRYLNKLVDKYNKSF